jgi:hypothetical protein
MVMAMRRTRALVVGAATFLALHFALMATWQRWIAHGDRLPPWFMNSVSAVVATTIVFAIVAALSSFRTPSAFDARAAWAALLATGGAVPMVVVLFTMRDGPGNLFPIAIVIGWVVMFGGSAIGAWVAWLVERVY